MPTVSLHYGFRQRFHVPAPDAFRWCTDFGPDDAALYPGRRTRSVRWIAPDALIMTDVTYPKGTRLRIRRLVRIRPKELAWTNTHLDGPYQYSQYWYQIFPSGSKASFLEFKGLLLENMSRTPSPPEVRRLAEAHRKSDAATWSEHLAPALERELRAK